MVKKAAALALEAPSPALKPGVAANKTSASAPEAAAVAKKASPPALEGANLILPNSL